MVKEPAGTRIITPPAELVNSEVTGFDMTIPPRSKRHSLRRTNCITGLRALTLNREEAADCNSGEWYGTPNMGLNLWGEVVLRTTSPLYENGTQQGGSMPNVFW